MDVFQLYARAFNCLQRAAAPAAEVLEDPTVDLGKQARSSAHGIGVKGWAGYCRKVGGYTRYKAACFKAYMLAYHALDRSQGTQGGAAVRLAQEASKTVQTATNLGREYDSLLPHTSELQRQAFSRSLQDRVKQIDVQCEKDNATVHLQRVPEKLPDPPAAKQLVSAVDYSFPLFDPSVDHSLFSCFDLSRAPDVVVDVAGDGGKDGGQKTAAWWRWLLVILAFPVIVVASLLGMLIWIVLLPVKIFCCPLGFAAQMMWDVTEWLIKAPAYLALWAAGKPWQPEKRDVRAMASGKIVKVEHCTNSQVSSACLH
eukprot:evm.model.scf_4178.1 EVM.evm.TU.scf_4178.1   scf_4178:5656-6594(+)